MITTKLRYVEYLFKLYGLEGFLIESDDEWCSCISSKLETESLLAMYAYRS